VFKKDKFSLKMHVTNMGITAEIKLKKEPAAQGGPEYFNLHGYGLRAGLVVFDFRQGKETSLHFAASR
jgi:hypothetical protein